MCAAGTAEPKNSQSKKAISRRPKGRKKVRPSDLGVIEYLKQEAAKQGIHDPCNSPEDTIPLGRFKQQMIRRQLDKKTVAQRMMWDRWFDEHRR